jgi:hypothetical protein
MPRTKLKLVTVDLPEYTSYCVNCSKKYTGTRDYCYCGGKQTRTRIVREVVRYKNVPEVVAKFLVRFQEARIVCYILFCGLLTKVLL